MDKFSKTFQPASFTQDQIGEEFWVRHKTRQVKLELLAISQGGRGIFRIGKNGKLSVHATMATLVLPDEEDISEEDDEVDSETAKKWAQEAAAQEEETQAFFKAQEKYTSLVMETLKLVDKKLQKAIAVLKTLKDDPDLAFLEPLKAIAAYLAERALEQEKGLGAFLCLPDQVGPNELEIASATETCINLYKPFFAESMTASKQADVLIHEAVHSCLKVPDYAYDWQHIFRFLPQAICLKNPDSYVHLVRKLYGETTVTPRSSDTLYDYTVGMIQHVCFRGSFLLRGMHKGAPGPDEILRTLRPKYDSEQQKALITLGTSRDINLIVSTIIGGKIKLITVDPVPTRLADVKASIDKDGTITLSYMKPTESLPYVGILARILQELNYGKSAVPVAKFLDEATARWHMAPIKEPTLS
ncbi:MAG TPA: hypothetical protein VGF67_05570 [Ktedonobacteraceae bacterium]